MRQPNSSRVPSQWLDLKKWPGPKEHEVPLRLRSRFRDYKRAITLHVLGRTYAQIEERLTINESDIRRTLARCLIPKGDGIVGWNACVKGFRANLPRRRDGDAVVELRPSVQNGSAGNAYRFKDLLDRFPEIEEEMRDEILKGGAVKFYEARVPIVSVHAQFVRRLREEGILEDQYPLSLDDQGYSSIRRYVKDMRLDDTEKYLLARYGEVAAKRAEMGTQEETLFPALRPFTSFGLDYQPIDAQTVVHYRNHAGGVSVVPVARWNVGYMFEACSRAVGAWEPNFEHTPSSSAMVSVVFSQMLPPLAGKTTPGDLTPRGGVLLNALVEKLRGNAMALIRLDRGSSNIERLAAINVMRATGAMLLYPPAGKFASRPQDERDIGSLTRAGLQRVASTLGGNPTDSRKNDPVGTAVAEEFHVSDALEIVSGVVEAVNLHGSHATDYKSPVEIAKRLLTEEGSGVIPLPIPVATDQEWYLFAHTVRVTIQGNEETGTQPYAEYQGCRFRNSRLKNAWDLVGKQADLSVNIRCPNEGELILVRDGRSLGLVKGPRSWMKGGGSLTLVQLRLRGTRRAKVRAKTSARDPVREHYDRKNGKVRNDQPGSSQEGPPGSAEVRVTPIRAKGKTPTYAEARQALHEQQAEQQANAFETSANEDDSAAETHTVEPDTDKENAGAAPTSGVPPSDGVDQNNEEEPLLARPAWLQPASTGSTIDEVDTDALEQRLNDNRRPDWYRRTY